MGHPCTQEIVIKTAANGNSDNFVEFSILHFQHLVSKISHYVIEETRVVRRVRPSLARTLGKARFIAYQLRWYI